MATEINFYKKILLVKMIEKFLKFHDLMNDNQISFVRNAFNDIIQGYKFYHISDNISLGEQV